MKKKIALLMAMVMLFAVTTAGTLAWLQDKTDPVVNTFTVGDINITLTETYNKDTDDDGENDTWEGKIIPGTDLTKDPLVTVESGSEACWLFVKVEEENWPTAVEEGTTTRKVNYAIASGWTALNDVPGVYYREVSASTSDQEFPVLLNNKVTVSNTLTKAEANAITTPKLTFTAYAVQAENFNTAAAAWTATFGASNS